MSIDYSKHSLFGASKAAADLLVQEYGRYFGMPTVSFRGGCLTGPAHAGTELHGFLSYLMICTVSGRPYRVLGYKGKQVRDNMHSSDLVRAFDRFFQSPRVAAVYNIGGSRFSNCSMLEAIAMCEKISGRKMEWEYVADNRMGDHIWWISDISKFQSDYPGYTLQYDVSAILPNFFDGGADDYARDPDVQKWLVEGGSSINPEVRKEAYSSAIKRITEQAYWAPLHSYVTTYGHAKQLAFTPYPDELPRFYLAKWN